ncbi:2-oxoacid:ferredoxin oxidoreductase subunit beta [Candidatus Pacearchaeota archaeon]|nr:2-oxoacid:ferredoxin oxidoreductase subunit beta [Candidatus Pacearchaeota archaeon]
MNTKDKLKTSSENTWCPGCSNHMILESVKQTISKFIDDKKFKQEDFAITTDIGCHAKIFDYINLSGIYCLHGRAIPTAIGMKLGNPNLKVLAFAGDGAVYSEGISHFIHAFKYNSDMTLILHDNQSFSLTTGQPTPTSQQGYVSKVNPLGVFDKPMNPIKIALASGATFIARTSARDIPHMTEIFTKAVDHKGFSFVEVIQDCLIFNVESNGKDSQMYGVKDNQDKKIAEKLADEFDYNSKKGKIPMGIIYQVKELTLEEKWPQLRELVDRKVGWVKK